MSVYVLFWIPPETNCQWKRLAPLPIRKAPYQRHIADGIQFAPV